MYEDLIGKYEREYWYRRIKSMIVQINDMSKSNHDYRAILKECDQKEEEFTIRTYFIWEDIYWKTIGKWYEGLM
ncbi:hypothetical protein [Faecalicoccus pleomorphus]|uniref:hypothetical protein n=1 Tax=Faecalicoccus pleomorphus TaxID=1323 RepID=UPI0026ED9B28|nr:hypothetical protein [Faecalicoccus pleomorphus]